MANIITSKTRHQKEWTSQRKDALHKRRKQIAGELKDGIFTKDQMNWHDCKGLGEEKKRVSDYMKWQAKNKPKMEEWAKINREFKANNEEGRKHDMDDVRKRKSIKYD